MEVVSYNWKMLCISCSQCLFIKPSDLVISLSLFLFWFSFNIWLAGLVFVFAFCSVLF